MADWARHVLSQAEGDLQVVGASMGGYCALEIARQAPERVRALALVGARAEGDSPERREGRAKTIDLIRTEGVESLWKDVAPKLFSPHADESVVAHAKEIALAQSPDDLVSAVEAIRDRADLTDVARNLDVPVLVAVGDSDPYFGVDVALALAGTLRNGTVHVFERCGHLPNLERNDDFDAVLSKFLRRAQ